MDFDSMNSFYVYTSNTYMNEQLTTNRECIGSVAKIENYEKKNVVTVFAIVRTMHINIDANRPRFPFPLSIPFHSFALPC